jgi:hypothetical protein
MKRLLKQETPMGPLYIVKDEGLFHIVWFGRRLGSAATLEAAMQLASGGQLGPSQRAERANGEAEMPAGVSADPTKWILTKS